jgi:hypothetical protein
MAIQTNGQISISDINTEFGLGNNLNAYRTTPWYTDQGNVGNFPSNNIAMNLFYGTRKNPIYTAAFRTYSTSMGTLTGNQYVMSDTMPYYDVIVIDAWGAGGGGAANWGPAGSGTAGGDTKVFSITAGGGGGGVVPGTTGNAGGRLIGTPGSAGQGSGANCLNYAGVPNPLGYREGGTAWNGGYGQNGYTGYNSDGANGQFPGAGGGSGNFDNAHGSWSWGGYGGGGAYCRSVINISDSGAPVPGQAFNLYIGKGGSRGITSLSSGSGGNGADGYIKIWFISAISTMPTGSGGNITTSGGYTIHTFNNNGTFIPTYSGLIELFMIGGGGGGGWGVGGGGGGGGGGIIYKAHQVIAGTSYPITIGGGGTGAVWNTVVPTNGGSTTGFGFTAYGGGYGGAYTYNNSNGGSGGSGGGGGYPSGVGGSGSNGDPNWLITQGYSGAYAISVNGGGGGSAGGFAPNFPNDTTNPTRAGLGYNCSMGALLGFGIGGLGGFNDGSGNGISAQNNTGNGGNGGNGNGTNGGNGGSGIVIIKYKTG